MAAESLEQVGPPVYASPTAPRRGPQRTALAGVIAFIAVVVAFWGILGYMHRMAETLASISTGSDRLIVQLGEANTGLAALDAKTAHVSKMSSESKRLRPLLAQIDGDMGTMITHVDAIGTEMAAMDTKLTELDAELVKVNKVTEGMDAKLTTINGDLSKQRTSVTAMQREGERNSRMLKLLAPKLRAINARLTHVNSVVCGMGTKGIVNNLRVKIGLGPVTAGSAEVVATVVHPGAWSCR